MNEIFCKTYNKNISSVSQVMKTMKILYKTPKNCKQLCSFKIQNCYWEQCFFYEQKLEKSHL